ncbi:hypothetical protein N7530_006288 [Penicillium desertorum]|uniref:Uncharacterized protein n=1 Tax=Penicillium desertorum TaxID=1303715 RepID=A0A9W9WRE1_9EURO|nr:hypothetical protein N7530_006288 [Penicillium desertorum]
MNTPAHASPFWYQDWVDSAGMQPITIRKSTARAYWTASSSTCQIIRPIDETSRSIQAQSTSKRAGFR